MEKDFPVERTNPKKKLCGLLLAMAFCCLANSAQAQKWLFNSRLPIGELGQMELARRPELANVWQPVLVRVPDGASIGFAEGAGFSIETANAELVSLQVGQAYRLKISNIPNNYMDVYPTIELIDRLHAPPGKETRYPIPIEITADELKMALAGKFVTRVIYVENPRNAIAARELPEQRYFEALPDEDPYEVARRLGRPVAILRMGSVVPRTNGLTAGFLLGSPPIQRHSLWPKQPAYAPSELKPSDLPAVPIKSAPLPNAPAPTEAEETLPEVTEDLPEKKELEEQPEDQDSNELDLFDDVEPFQEVDQNEDLGSDLGSDELDSGEPDFEVSDDGADAFPEPDGVEDDLFDDF